MNLITFVFSGFWVWLGFVILVGLVLQQVVEMIKAIRTKKQVEAYRIGERWHFKITGASKADIEKDETGWSWCRGKRGRQWR